MLEEFKEDCMFFVQHYSYNSKKKRLFKISCGHCSKTKRSKCKDCPHYQPHDISEEVICFSVFRMFYQFNQVLNMYQQQLAKELKTYKHKDTD